MAFLGRIVTNLCRAKSFDHALGMWRQATFLVPVSSDSIDQIIADRP